MSEEAAQLEEKQVEAVEVVKIDETHSIEPKPKAQEKDLSGPLAYLSLFSLPFGYMVSSLSGAYATHATFAMVALFLICSLTTPVQNGRYTGFLFALLWTCAGILFYQMRGI